MALMALILHVSSVSFCLLITFLIFEDSKATATRDGLFGWKNFGSNNYSSSGLCASSVVAHGYKCQEFKVTTKDGYILKMQRIPRGRYRTVAGKIRPPVILQHGVLVDGTTWLLNQPNQNLPFILADNGFDVWISNTRGTKYSNRHVHLHIYEPRYWDWTWDDLAIYDLPAVVNFVYNQTSQRVHYIGHSQATLIAMISLSQGKLVEKLKSATLLTPIAYLTHIKTQFGLIAARTFLDQLFKYYSIPMFDPIGEPVHQMLESFCAHPGINCFDIVAGLTGKNCCLNQTTMDILLQNEPQPTSVKNMAHFAQSVRKGVVAKYDYGIYNGIHYGQSTPPLYNLSHIPRSFPLFLAYGGRDALSDVEDVRLLLDDLRCHDENKIEVLYIKEYAHLDFIMGVNANRRVYNDVIKFLRRW